MKILISTKQFNMQFAPKAVTPPVALRYLSSPFHAIRPKIQHLCDNRDRNTLWWRVSTRNLLSYKRVVRSWCARRVRNAFRQELRERGFDAEGRILEPGSPSIDGIRGNLKGSINIFPTTACIAEKYPAVQAEVKTLMDALVRQQLAQQYIQRKQSQRRQSRGLQSPQ